MICADILSRLDGDRIFSEALRYWGVHGSDNAVDGEIDMMRRATAEVSAAAKPRFSCDILPLVLNDADGNIRIEDIPYAGKGLTKRLEGCDGAAVIAVTAGFEIDRLVSRYDKINIAYAAALSAAGSAWTEEFTDRLEESLSGELCKSGKILTRRFSPGYGDLPLSMQTELFTSLGITKKTGIILGDGLLMKPEKSVTAIMGIGKEDTNE